MGKFIDLTNKEYVKCLGIWLIATSLGNTKSNPSALRSVKAQIKTFCSPRHSTYFIYKSLIHLYLSYGICAWGQASKSLLNKHWYYKSAPSSLYFSAIKEIAPSHYLLNVKFFHSTYCIGNQLWTLCTMLSTKNVQKI